MNVVCACTVAVGLFAGAALAQTTYFDSNGFESPQFHLGQLAGETYWSGQDRWVGVALPNFYANMDAFTVQSSVVRSGAAAAKFDAGLQQAGTTRTELYRGTIFAVEHRYMDLSVDLMLSATGTASGEWILAQQQSAVIGLSQLGIHTDGRLHVLDYATGQEAFSAPVFTRGEWHTVRSRADYLTDRITYWVDDQQVLDVGMTPNISLYGLVGFFNEAPGTDAMYIDNLRIVNNPVPAPGAAAILALSGLIGVRRRQRRSM